MKERLHVLMRSPNDFVDQSVQEVSKGDNLVLGIVRLSLYKSLSHLQVCYFTVTYVRVVGPDWSRAYSGCHEEGGKPAYYL